MVAAASTATTTRTLSRLVRRGCLRDEARDWLQGTGPRLAASARSTRPCSASCASGCSAWIDRETGGRTRSPVPPRSPPGAPPSSRPFNGDQGQVRRDPGRRDAKKKQAMDAGGLYVLGTERHESRRIDNQLRGRSGRQGDPGRSKFYLSLEDDLMRIFGSDRMDGMLQKLGLQEGEAITHPWINKALEKAQQKVEARNFDSRKYVLKYDDVMNDQRKVIFEHRIDIMGRDDVSETVNDLRQQVVQRAGGASASRRMPTPSSGTPPKLKDEIAAHLRPRSADRQVGRRGRHRRPGDHRAAAEGGRRQGHGEGGRVRPRDDAPDREDGAAADARPPLARASGHARASAPGDRLPQLRSARSAQRVQVRRLPPVRDHAGQPARGRHRPAHAHPGHAARRTSTGDAAGRPAADAGASRRSVHRARTSWPWRTPLWPPPAGPMAREAERRAPLQTRRAADAARSRRTPRPGARSRATRRVRAARARSTSTATASTTDPCGCTGGR